MKHINKIKLSAFLDGEVSDEERIEISKHIKSCDHCQKELESLSHVSDSLDLIEEIQVPPYFLVHLKQRIAEQESRKVIQSPFVTWARRVAVPVGAAALIIFSLFLGDYMGKAIYQSRIEDLTRLDTEFAELLCVNSLEDFSEGSLNNVYYNLVSREGE